MSTDYEAANYCVSWMDLLGTRERYKGQGLIPKTLEEQVALKKVVEDTVGRIDQLQNRAAGLLANTATEHVPSIQSMAFGDSILHYASLRDGDTPAYSIFQMLLQSGLLCILGLAEGLPLRGAMDVAWAVEVRPGQLCGAAPVKAYEYESRISQYPRIVVSSRVIGYIQAHIRPPNSKPVNPVQAELAQKCQELIGGDSDGYRFVDYLNPAFRSGLSQQDADKLYQPALNYVQAQLVKYQADDNPKMAGRYWKLLQYFEHHRENWVKERESDS